ncbi:MAG: tetratricopeptide repeat protein, partial [Candidatus Desantisbacteria bacterium]
MRKVLCGIVLVAFSLSIVGCVGMRMPDSFQVVMKAEKESRKGKHEKAVNMLEEYQKTHPDMPPGEILWQKDALVQCHLEMGQTSTAISILDEFLKSQPYQEDEYPYLELARLYLQQGDKQKAEDMFAKAKELANINLRFDIGWQYEEAKELDRAIEIYTCISQDAPYCYKAYTCLGDVFRQKGDINKAISNYEKGLELNPVDVDANMCVGSLYAISGKKDKAKQAFEKVVKVCREVDKEIKAILTFLNSAAYTAFLQDEEALKYIQQGDMNTAIEACKEKVALEPKTLKWHFYLAVLYSIKEEG